MTITLVVFGEQHPEKTAGNTVKHQGGGVGSAIANQGGGGKNLVTITTLYCTLTIVIMYCVLEAILLMPC